MSTNLIALLKTIQSYFVNSRTIAPLIKFFIIATLYITLCVALVFLATTAVYYLSADASLSYMSASYVDYDFITILNGGNLFKTDLDKLLLTSKEQNSIKDLVLELPYTEQLDTIINPVQNNNLGRMRGRDPIHEAIHDEVFIKIMEKRRKSPEEIKARRALISKLVGYDIDSGFNYEIIKD